MESEQYAVLYATARTGVAPHPAKFEHRPAPWIVDGVGSQI